MAGPWTDVLVIIFLLFYFSVQFSFSTIPKVWPIEIKFDYEPGHNNDAVNIKKNRYNDVPVPEWEYIGGSEISENFAYIKGQTSRKIKVKFGSNCDRMNLFVSASVTSGTGIEKICTFFLCDYESEEEVELTIEGTILGSVGKRTFTWKWDYY